MSSTLPWGLWVLVTSLSPVLHTSSLAVQEEYVRSQRCWCQVWELHIYKDFEVTSPWSLQGACGL